MAKIKKRNEIEDGIYEELSKKYPLKSEKNGVCYAQNLTFFCIDVEDYNKPVFRLLVKENSKSLVVYTFLRECMCHRGWYIEWDMFGKADILERLTLWGISEEECLQIIESLLEKSLLFKFEHEGKEYLTDAQQIFNFEILQEKRARDRKRKSDRNNSGENESGSEAGNTKPVDNIPPDFLPFFE